MKLFYFILLIFATESMANSSKVLKCLGAEESKMHHPENPIGGAFYELNKSMISFIVQFQDTTEFKDQYVQEICQESLSSFHLLRLFLTRNTGVLKRSRKVIPGLSASSPESIAKNSYKMLITFLGQYQSQLSSAKCLTKQIPELKEFLERAKHFETDVNYQELVKELPNIDVLMDKLLGHDLSKQC